MNMAWLAAVLIPAALAPAFDGDPRASNRPEVDLAALLLGRTPSWRRTSRSKQNVPAVDELLHFVEQLMHLDSQDVGIRGLVDSLLSDDSREDQCKTAALALTVAPFIASHDQYARCEAVLTAAMAKIDTRGSKRNLLLAALHVQRGLRRRDRGVVFLDDVTAALDLLLQVDPGACADFDLSETSTANPLDVVERIIAVLRRSAWSLVPGGPFVDEAIHGHAPTAPHERVFSWTIDELTIASEVATQYDRWLDELYSAELQRAAVTTWGRREPDLYYQALALELLGHKSVFSYRRQLALMRVVRSLPSLQRPDLAGCLRLLRHAEAEKELDLLVRRVLTGGPLDALAIDCRQIISNRLSDSSIRAVELTMLSAGADLLSRTEADAALAPVLDLIEKGGPRAAPGAYRLDSRRHETAWFAAAALGSAAGASSLVADRLLLEVLAHGLEDELWDRVVAGTIRRITWPDVSPSVQDRWKGFIRHVALPDSIAIASARSALKIPGVPTDDASVHSLDWALDRINSYIREDIKPSDDDVSEIFNLAVEDMREIAARAAIGTYSGYSITAAEIAAHAITYMKEVDEDTWSTILDFLTDTRIPRADRTLGFDALRRPTPAIPTGLVAKYRERVMAAIESEDISLIAPDTTFSPYPAALRFGFAHAFITDDDAFTYTARLISKGARSATEEAAATIATFSTVSDAGWIQTLAVQLSHDSNPHVRTETIYALARIADRGSSTSSIAVRRLVELLLEDGISVPQNALTAASRMNHIPPSVYEVINGLKGNHPSRKIRTHAANIISQRT